MTEAAEAVLERYLKLCDDDTRAAVERWRAEDPEGLEAELETNAHRLTAAMDETEAVMAAAFAAERARCRAIIFATGLDQVAYALRLVEEGVPAEEAIRRLEHDRHCGGWFARAFAERRLCNDSQHL